MAKRLCGKHILNPVLAASLAAFALSACGGGGGGGSSNLTGGPALMEEMGGNEGGLSGQNLGGELLSHEADGDSLNSISGHDPRQGSVTQGTRGENNVTLDSTGYDPQTRTVTINGDTEIPIERVRWSGFNYGTDGLAEDYNGPYFLEGTDEDGLRGRAIAYVMSRVERDENGLPTTYTLDDTDPVVMGTWAYIADDDTTVVIGTFVDGLAESETPGADIPIGGTATFDGHSYGWLSGEAIDTLGYGSIHFSATANLTADWGNSNIDGTIDNFLILLSPNIPDSDLPPADERGPRNDFSFQLAAGESPTITLQSANIDRTNPGGFFTGDTAYSSPGASGNGRWGGQFYGGNAEHVAGTWGVNAQTDEDALSFTASGSFSASQPTTQ